MIVKRLRPVISLVALIWAVEVVNFFLGHSLVSWGILPRSVGGLAGIPLAPMLHGGIWHTISNTVPLLILGSLTLARGQAKFLETTVNIVLLSGVLVWLFARGSYHVGASGLVFGLFGAILARAVMERSLSSMIIGIITVMLYGGLIWGILPLRNHVSFESHLFGLIAGIFVVWLEAKLNRSKPAS
ncbi:MAG: rhomboid family intramembrane serine protease [Alphaproteobacteria bacterium]|jgi:membrane associated rhomboid family serine protease|nr:rhomboid family intramembrane serine protease [Rhodospirillaceae bacterium]MDP6021966.1 rhomboid family intramembrane serine protease [Alphaproteobacteria bacterium]MDP6254522.1 rhomboid family intramembrane serine protease [Alphaproteobacteria bacterium]MDP7055696.1 rhomboid family intramembrane serine protease [Alphaproteobacteria bacterium]MDP7229341.1 rhomboid family intramembrane serine protease [Alphaproteobacteria bacterium]|tara:strand:- start:4376 stop:4933 length:558 start_codon:yes stop_codon:yes gene_type:complete